MASYQAWNELPPVCRGSDRELARAAEASAVRGVRLRGADDENEKARRSFRCGVAGAKGAARTSGTARVSRDCASRQKLSWTLPHWIAKWRS
jgi:hypothetical protein